ncbi:MAG: hypothetical protein CMH97_06130 [Oceanospirillaceae bacterium]|nr:hypothetical protein [Oceanospirillaceae bacterium]
MTHRAIHIVGLLLSSLFVSKKKRPRSYPRAPMLINTTQNDDTNVGVWTAESGSLPMHKVLVMTKQKECQL